MVGATSTQIMEFVCLAHANLYDERIQLTSLASLGIGMTNLVYGKVNHVTYVGQKAVYMITIVYNVVNEPSY